MPTNKQPNNKTKLLIQINEIDEEKRHNLVTRTRTGTVITFWAIFYLVFSALASSNWLPNFKWGLRLSFNMINVLFLVPILFFSIKEICNLCFPNNKKIFLSFVILSFVIFISNSLVLLLSLPSRSNMSILGVDQIKAYRWYILILYSTFLVILFTSFTTSFILFKKHIVEKMRNVWTFSFVLFLISLFVNSFFYVTVIHEWTTLLILIALPIFSDVFAYLSGLIVGKHKMTPKLSPKKTWEGLLGSFILTTVILCGIYGLFTISENHWHSLYYFLGCQTCQVGNNLKPYFWAIYSLTTIAMVGVSTGGDLFFSYIKRKFNIKDYSNILPGHGGMLDRIDSMIYVFLTYFIITTILMAVCPNSGIAFVWK